MIACIMELLFITTAAISAGIAASIPAWAAVPDTDLAIPVRGIALGYAIFVFGVVMLSRS